jgi:GAF domain-containing protein
MKDELERARRQVSEYAMALDLLARLSHSDSEKQAIANITEIFTALFSPKKINYVALERARPGADSPVRATGQNSREDQSAPAVFPGKFTWTPSTQGFCVKIFHRERPLGIIEVDGIAFPEYKEQYLNLALSMVDVCGLVIENARKREQLQDSEARLRQERDKLEEALAEVRQLSGLLPICMHCKKIRDDQGYWKRIETYIEEHSGAEFSHGICEECLNTFYPE